MNPPSPAQLTMLHKPASCSGCPLQGEGFLRPSLAGKGGYGVVLLGEHRAHDDTTSPFTGKSGFKLTRLIEWAGLEREKFDIYPSIWCHPPNNVLEGLPIEEHAVRHCRGAHWGHLLDRARVVVPMGNVPMAALLGRKGILKQRGYIRPLPPTLPDGWCAPVRGGAGIHVVPTINPAFIQRGQSKYSAPFIHDLQKSVTLARDGLVVEVSDYTLDPSPAGAMNWAEGYLAALRADPLTYLAFDIETPGKGEDEGDLDTDDPTYFIHRIGFSYRPLHALSVPWTPEYIPAIRLLLGTAGPKVVWNAGFDVPRVKGNGVGIEGLIHDGMIAWHVLHSDLPKGLGFVATFTCPWQREWKTSIVHSNPALYNAIDADVELRSMLAIERELRENGLWGVYERDVVELDPILIHMTQRGMPLDPSIRLDRAIKLKERQDETITTMEGIVPIGARRWTPINGYTRTPPSTTGLITIKVTVPVRRCSVCGLVNPLKPHFRTLKRPTAKRPQNPCAGGVAAEKMEEIERFTRLDPFKPSREQLFRYQDAMGRMIPTQWDKKTKTRKASMNEKVIKGLIKKYPDDPLYPLVLAYRRLDKIAGTYIGRPVDES